MDGSFAGGDPLSCTDSQRSRVWPVLVGRSWIPDRNGRLERATAAHPFVLSWSSRSSYLPEHVRLIPLSDCLPLPLRHATSPQGVVLCNPCFSPFGHCREVQVSLGERKGTCLLIEEGGYHLDISFPSASYCTRTAYYVCGYHSL